MATLIKPTIDYDEILKESKGVELRRIAEKLRSEIELFYSRGSVADAIASLNKKHDEKKQTLQFLQGITLENKSDDELIELLKDRNELMSEHALQLLHKKVVTLHNYSSDLISKLRQNVPSLVRTLGTKEIESLLLTLDILNAIMDDSVKHKFRESNGMRPLAKLLLMPELMSDSNFVVTLLKVIFQIVTVEENKDNFRSVNGVLTLLPLLTHTQAHVVVLASDSLAVLADLENNQIAIAKSQGVLRQIVKNAKSSDFNVKLSSLRLLRNIAKCSVARETFSFDDFRTILGLLDAKKIYQNDSAKDYQDSLTITNIILDLIYELAGEERNLRTLGQLGILKSLDEYFYPLKNNVRWVIDVLIRVLKLIERILQLPQNCRIFIESKGITPIVEIIRSPSNFPEEILMDAATIITLVATKTTMNQQAYGKLGVQLLLMLLKQYPTHEYIHELVTQMICSAASSGLNNEMLVKEGCDKVLMMFLRDSKVDKVLKYSCAGLAEFCVMEGKLTYMDPPTEIKTYVVKTIFQSRVVQNLIGLLQLGWSELNSSVARVLAAITDLGEPGLVEIVKHGGIVPLVKLLGEKDKDVKEQALLTFGKILFGPGQLGDEYIQYFFDERGEIPLLECTLSKEVEVQVPALSILTNLSTHNENIEILRDAGIEEKMRKLEKHPNVTKTGSQITGFVSIINKNLKQDKLNQRRLRTKQQAAAKLEKKMPVWWLKMYYEHVCKMIPVRDTITFDEFIELIKTEFGVNDWTDIVMRNKENDAAKINDQRSLSYAIDCVQKEFEIDFVIKPIKYIISLPTDGKLNAQVSKLDSLLQRLTHRQLRILIKDAIDQGIDIAEPIKQYISLNRKVKVTEERAKGQPYGKGPTSNVSLGTGQENRRRRRDQKEQDAKISTPGSGPPPPPPAPAPPPPPKLQIAKGKAGTGKTGSGPSINDQLMQDLNKKLETSNKGLSSVLLDEDELKKRGDTDSIGFSASKLRHTTVEEEVDKGPEIWRYNLQSYIDTLVNIFLSNYDIMNIVFEVVDSNQIDFSEAMVKFTEKTKMEKSLLSKSMLDCGFTVKYTVYTNDKTYETTREYTSIICPIELPSYIVLKLIRAMLNANGGNKIDTESEIEHDSNTVVRGYWSKGGTAPSAAPAKTFSTPSTSKVTVQGKWAEKKKTQPVTDDPSKPIIQGYWASKKEKPEIVSGSLFDNDVPPSQDKKPVVQGYWSKKGKEERKITSIWDE